MSKALQEKLRHVLINTVGSVVELPDSALSLALLSGKATLGPGLKIKKDLFEQLGLPVVLTAGSIESIDIEIPTAHLRTKPVVVRIKQVLITLSPNPDANTRRAKLAAQERLWQQAADEGEGVDPESAMGKMVQKIVDNIHIIAEDVHIRLEDTRTGGSGSQENDRYAMGLVLDSFSLRSFVVSRPGARWTETCEKPVQRFLNKCLVFGANGQRQGESGLGIYVHPGEAPMPDPGTAPWRNAMLEYIMGPAAARGAGGRGGGGGGGAPPTVSWVLGPSVIEARVSLDKQESFDGCFSRCWNAMEGAKQEIKLFVANLPIKLRHTALRNLYGLLFFYQNVSRWQQLKQNRPSGPVQGNARQWWQFAIQCELNDINRKTISIEALRKVTRDGHDYVEMYSRKAGAGRPWLTALDAEETVRLQAFEDRYPADVTKTFRIRAWRVLLDGDKERQGQIQEERDVQNALLAAPSGRWGRTDLHSNFVVEHSGMVAVESGGSARKKTKESYVVVVSLPMGEAIPSIREGWLERRTNKEGNRWVRHYFVLTADEFYHSAKKGAGAKKFRVSLSSCHAPSVRSDAVSFEMKSKDASFILRTDDDEIRQAWVKDIGDAITKRSTVETIMFDPTKHLGDANLENISFTLHVKMEAASPTKSSFRKKKTAMDDVLLYMTPEAFMICSFQPVTEEVAAELTELQVVRLDNADGGEAIHRVTTRFTFKRLRTWSLEQNSACCKVEVTQNAGSLTALRFFSSEGTQAEEVMEAIQSCIAAVISKQKRAKERRAEIKAEIVALFEEHDPEKSGEIDQLLKAKPGEKAEELLLQLRAQYVSETTESADDAPSEVRVSFMEDGPLGISFGSESGDTPGWIDAIKPTGLAANFPELKHGLMLVAVQDEPVATYQQAIDAIMATGRPLHLTFRDSSTGSATPPVDADPKAEEASAEPSAGTNGSGEASPEPEMAGTAAETTEDGSAVADGAGASRSTWLLRYATNSEDRAAEAIHLASYMNDTPAKTRKEYTYESELTVKHLDGFVHRFSVATTDEKSSTKLANILDSGASKGIDLSSTPTVTPAQEELLDTMDVMQSFSFGASYTDGGDDDDDDTPRASIRESRRTVTPPGGASTPQLSTTAEDGEAIMSMPMGTSGKVMYDTITHASILMEHVEVELSMAGYDICKLKGTGITADTMYNLHEAKRTSLAIVDAHVVDLYSRDSVFEKVLSAIQPAKFDSRGASEGGLGDDDWQTVPLRTDSAGPVSDPSPDMKGRRSSIEDVLMEEPSPGASSVEDTWSTTGPVVDPMLFCEYELAGEANLRLGDAPYATSTTLKLRPVRLVANCALLPVLQDFVKLQDFKVMQQASKKGRIDRLRNDVDAASVVQPTRFVDIAISGPEFVLPESSSIEDDDTSIFMWTAEEISLKTDVVAAEEEVKQKSETASVTALRAFICNRATLLESTAAREQRALEVPLWLWLEPGGAEGPIPLPFSVTMCAKLEAAMAAGEDSCENDDAGPMGGSFVQFKSAPPFDISCIDPDAGQAAKIVSGSAEKGELEYCKVYRDVESGLASRPPAVEQFFDDFRKNKEPEEMRRARASGILLPFTASAALKRSGGASTDEAELDIICQADRLQLQLSGKALKELLVIAMHAGEAAYIHNASLARFVKTMLYEQKTWPWQRRRSKKSAGEGADGQGSSGLSSSSAAKKLGGMLGKLAGSKGKMAVKAAGLAKTVGTGLAASVKEAAAVDSHGGGDDTSSADPPEEATTGQGDAPLVCAQLKLGLLDITLKGEPRGSDSSIEPLTLGVRAHGVETGLLLSTAEARTHCALEGIEIIHSQAQDVGGEASDSERNFTSWPRAGLRMIRSEAPTAVDEQGERTTVLEAFKTGDSDKTIELKKPKDLLSVVDAKELARILPVISEVLSEAERVLAIAKPFAARVGLAKKIKIPGKISKYTDYLSELAGATEELTGADIVADQAAAVAEVRAKLRTLVDQQVAKYSAVAEGMIGGLDTDSAGALGSTVTELAQGALRGETDVEKAKADLRTHLGAVAREKIDALSVEIEKDLTAAEEAAEGGSSMKTQVARIVLGGAQNVVSAAISADGLDASRMRELVREQTVALEAEIKAEVNSQLAQRVADMNIEGQISALATQLDATAEGGASADDVSDIAGLKARVSRIVLGGAQELVAATVSGDGLDAAHVRELVVKQAGALEAEVKDEVSQRVAQRVKDLNLDQLGDEALSPVLQKENARLAAELEKLAAENAALKEELQRATAGS